MENMINEMAEKFKAGLQECMCVVIVGKESSGRWATSNPPKSPLSGGTFRDLRRNFIDLTLQCPFPRP